LINQFLVELDGIDSNNDGVLEMTIIEDIQGLMDYEDLVILHNLINKPNEQYQDFPRSDDMLTRTVQDVLLFVWSNPLRNPMDTDSILRKNTG